MGQEESERGSDRWARFRFGVVAPLYASPPAHGELEAELERLAGKTWVHPIHGKPYAPKARTIETWYYQARDKDDPVAALRRKRRSDSGQQWSVSDGVAEAIQAQYKRHSGWCVQLHHDNLAVVVEEKPSLGACPSYSSLIRFMVSHGMAKKRRPRRPLTAGEQAAAQRLETREVRGYEAEFTNGLWHLDFHSCSRTVLTPEGAREIPKALGILDDRSRWCPHLQWYLGETASDLVHGVRQGLLKGDLPRELMSDNGAAMVSAEFTQGLLRLGIHHATTLPYSPFQNGKQESFWGQVEGRLIAMLEGQKELTLSLLNEATQAWVELEYNRKEHSETGQPPLERFVQGPSVARRCPSPDTLDLAFLGEETRSQARRRDDLHRRPTVRDPLPLPASAARHGPLCPLGPAPGRSRRPAHGRRLVAPVSRRPRQECLGPTSPPAEPRASTRARCNRGRHRTVPAPADVQLRGHGPATRLSAEVRPGGRRVSRNRRLTVPFGLKWHPFSADVPSEALVHTPQIDLFLSRVESLLDTGGFALITGDSGTGKSVTLRLLCEHLASLRDTVVGVLSRPQSSLGDFYRELGHLFGVPLAPHNRWAQYKVLRERWAAHFDSTFLRPVLLVDEAQQTSPVVLSELRILSSEHFDSRSLLTVVLCGDSRLPELFRQPDLVPLGSRIRLRLELGPRSPHELLEMLSHALSKAGCPSLITPDLMKTIAEHSAGNYRVLFNTASQLLEEAARQNATLIDDRIYFDLFPTPTRAPRPRATASASRS